MDKSVPVIGIVAGEASGDLLGRSLMRAIKAIWPHAQFIGVGGVHMLQEGLTALGDIETLSVMGLIEPLKKLPQILKLRNRLINHFTKNKPICFIGIDAPDFNIGLEKKLKQQHISTVHLVSPTVWAWRANRIHGIKKAVDLMLLIYPFEKGIYDQHQIKSCYIGHPLADEIPNESTIQAKQAARAALNVADNQTVVGLLPGSRAAEIRYLGDAFFQTAIWLNQRKENLLFIVPCVNQARKMQAASALRAYPNLTNVILVDGQADLVMQASDAILLASGTAALQAAFYQRLFVVAYKMSGLSYQLAKRLIKLKHISMPNIILGRTVVPECIQTDVHPEKMGTLLLDYLQNEQNYQAVFDDLKQLKHQLTCDAGMRAAEAVIDFIQENNNQENNNDHCRYGRSRTGTTRRASHRSSSNITPSI